MTRLFTPSRDISFIRDIGKEIVKDVVGQKIYYFPVSIKTKLDDIYNEAPEKIFENAIELDAMVANDTWETKTNRFGGDYENTIELWVQAKDLLDKKIFLAEGDFFSYGDIVYEVVSFFAMNSIHGQTEYDNDFKITGKISRKSTVSIPLAPPTQQGMGPWIEDDGVQHIFQQQQGVKELNGKVTGDVRELQDNGKIERIGQPRVVSPQGAIPYENEESSFYDE